MSEQLFVEVYRDGEHIPRSSRLWRKAIRVLLRDARLKSWRCYEPLAIPSVGISDGFTLTHAGIRFRCLTQYRLVPVPSGYIGRVDVAGHV